MSLAEQGLMSAVDRKDSSAGAAERPIRTVVVDDHDLFRTGLARVLSGHEDVEIVGQASRGRMAVRLVRELHPDVVLMDLEMPDLNGNEATRLILDEDPDARVLIVTVSHREADVMSAVVAGACGYVLKDGPVEDLVHAVRAANRDEPWFCSRAIRALLERMRRDRLGRPPESKGAEDLSPRELEVLRLLARGLENNEIAAALRISTRTARNHVSSILSKLGVRNRIQAAVYAIHHGLG